jgi:hypothetical protein
MIPSKKTGWQCCLMIKHYLHTDTILGKYEDEHDHAIGDENLRFTRLLDTTKALVMDMVCTGIDSKAIVHDELYFYSWSNSYLAKTCVGIFYVKSLQLPYYNTQHHTPLSDCGEQGD